MGSHVGLVTGTAAPKLTEDGQELQRTLRSRGHDVRAVVWSERSLDWSTFDALVVRSCWEYYQQPSAFATWLDTIEDTVRTVINPVDILEWNMHKSYLHDLAAQHVLTAPTRCIEQGTRESLAEICERTGWDHVVVKPAIGTSSAGVWQATTPISPTALDRFQQAVGAQDLLVQEFIPEIARGELSMVYLGGEFSHANRTIPTSGDFRAHHSHGASSKSVSPSIALRDLGREVLDAVGEIHDTDPSTLVYARVDGVERDGSFVLLELELIEPYLGLSNSDGAVERFADAIERRLAIDTDIPGIQ